MNSQYDIVVSGAGMVGATLCCALADSGLRVAVIESRHIASTWPDDDDDLRVSAITAASEQIFKSLNAWQAITEHGISPYRDMHVWDATGDGAIHFDSANIGEARLGHIVKNRIIQTALQLKMRCANNMTLLYPHSIQSFNVNTDHVAIRLDDAQQIEARLLIGADGGQSRVRQLAGIEIDTRDYQQKAIVATVTSELPHQETASQRFMPNGPLAFLPLADGRCSIVWSTTPEQADELLAMDEDDFCDALGSAFEYRLGQITASSPRAAFPLRSAHAKQYVLPRLALIGDAAHTVHPLAGQGVNLGLLDAATLAETIEQAKAKNIDIGSLSSLRRFERWRKGDNLLTMATMTGFQQLFSNNNQTVSRLRNTGLKISNTLPPLKNHIMKHALGLKGDLPKIARPTFY